MLVKPYFGDREVIGLFRVGGPGLGNLLFPYCRAHILSLEKNIEMIPPIWPTIKIGPIIRMEKEQRFYLNLFRSFTAKRLSLLLKSRNFKEVNEDEVGKTYQLDEKTVIKVSGLRNYFKDLIGYNLELREFLYQTAAKNIQSKVDAFDGNRSIGLHIRLGDYDEAGKTAIAWYLEKIKQLQQNPTLATMELIVFSDGKDSELNEILSLPNCSRVKKPDALSDILRLSKCKIIIGSNSTFSAWSAFLGKRTFIRDDKFYMGKLFNEKDEIYEGSLQNLSSEDLIRTTNLFS